MIGVATRLHGWQAAPIGQAMKQRVSSRRCWRGKPHDPGDRNRALAHAWAHTCRSRFDCGDVGRPERDAPYRRQAVDARGKLDANDALSGALGAYGLWLLAA